MSRAPKVIVQECADKSDALRFQKDHPTDTVDVRIKVCGKRALQFKALLELAGTRGQSTDDMLYSIVKCGIDREYSYWKFIHK